MECCTSWSRWGLHAHQYFLRELTPVIPAVRSLKQENDEFKANLGYIGRPCLKKLPPNPSFTENQFISPNTNYIQ
jgi:hypothetical protein